MRAASKKDRVDRGQIHHATSARPKPDPEIGKHVARQKKEQQHSLKGLNGGGGQAQHELREFAADVGQRHEKPRQGGCPPGADARERPR